MHFRIESFVGKNTEHIAIVESRISAALERAGDFYLNNGIDLKVIPSFDLSQSYQPEPFPDSYKLIYLRPYRGDTMNILRWGLNPDWPIEQLAMIYAHELTHQFGILDEYFKIHGQNQGEIGEEDSLMRNWDHPEVRLYPRHIEKMLEYFCKNDE